MTDTLDAIERILARNPGTQPEPDELAELIAALKQYGKDDTKPKSRAKRIRELEEDEGCSHAEAVAWVDFDLDYQPEQLYQGKPYPHHDTLAERDA